MDHELRKRGTNARPRADLKKPRALVKWRVYITAAPQGRNRIQSVLPVAKAARSVSETP